MWCSNSTWLHRKCCVGTDFQVCIFSKTRLGSASGPHIRLLHPLLPKGKVRAVVFMRLGTRQALGLREAPACHRSGASWFPAPELWVGGWGLGRGGAAL